MRTPTFHGGWGHVGVPLRQGSGQASSPQPTAFSERAVIEGCDGGSPYAYTDTEVTKDNSGLEGNELDNVPLHSGSAFLTYEFKNYDPLQGLRFGFGVFAAGDRQRNPQNDFILPGYVRLDAFAGYCRNLGPTRVTAQLNIENLTDKEYFEGTDVFFQSGPRLGIFLRKTAEWPE